MSSIDIAIFHVNNSLSILIQNRSTCEIVIAIPLCDIPANVFIILYITTATPSVTKYKTLTSTIVIIGYI